MRALQTANQFSAGSKSSVNQKLPPSPGPRMMRKVIGSFLCLLAGSSSSWISPDCLEALRRGEDDCRSAVNRTTPSPPPAVNLEE